MNQMQLCWPKEGQIPQLNDFTEKDGILSFGPYILKNSENGWSSIICKAEDGRYEKVTVSEKNETSIKALAALQRHLEAEKPAKEKNKKKEALIKEYLEYGKTHSIQNAKSGFVTCNVCRSLLNKKMLPSNRCPLCGSDLRPRSVLETLQRYRDRINDTPA